MGLREGQHVSSGSNNNNNDNNSYMNNDRNDRAVKQYFLTLSGISSLWLLILHYYYYSVCNNDRSVFPSLFCVDIIQIMQQHLLSIYLYIVYIYFFKCMTLSYQ